MASDQKPYPIDGFAPSKWFIFGPNGEWIRNASNDPYVTYRGRVEQLIDGTPSYIIDERWYLAD